MFILYISRTMCACKDAYLKFLRLNKICIINEDWHSQLLQARNATPQDLGIVISYSGATVEIIDILYTALANDQYESSLEQLSRTHIHKPGQTAGKFL